MRTAKAEVVKFEGKAGFPLGACLLDGPDAGTTFILDDLDLEIAGDVGMHVTVRYSPDDQFATRVTETPIERVKTWKVETTTEGVILTLNGKRYRTESGEAIAFDLGRAARGLNGHYEGVE